MKYILLTFCTFISYFALLQDWKNYVPNYSFEVIDPQWVEMTEHTNSHNNPESSGQGGYNGTFCYDYIQLYWSHVLEWTHPIPINLADCEGVPTADVYMVGRQTNPRTGTYWGHTHGEQLVVPLLYNGLQSDKTYYIEFFNMSSTTTGEVSLHKDQPEGDWDTDYHNSLLNTQPALDFNAQYTTGWTRYKNYFRINDQEKDWLVAGSSGTWDDFRIYEVQENGCRDNWYFDNTEFNYDFEIFQASEKIFVGDGVDPEATHFSGPVVVRSNSHTILKAGEQVVMGPGFSTEDGAHFETIIEPNNCVEGNCPNKLIFNAPEIICSTDPIEIGDPNMSSWGTEITWSPSTHLSNPNIGNPIFTPPAGANTIVYTVTTTYTCDTGIEVTQEHTVPVSFNNSGVTDANFSITNIDFDDYLISFDVSDISEGVDQIDIWIGSYLVGGYGRHLDRGLDWNGNSYHFWENGDNWYSCENQTITVTATNSCSGETNTQSVLWDKQQDGNTPSFQSTQWNYTTQSYCYEPNYMHQVFYPNAYWGDEVNCHHRDYCAKFYNTDEVSWVIRNSYGGDIYEANSIPIEDWQNPICLWNGHLNNDPSQPYVSDGTYFLYLRLWNNCMEGDIDDVEPIRTFVQFNSGTLGGKSGNVTDSIVLASGAGNNETLLLESNQDIGEDSDLFEVFPNPTTGKIQVISSYDFEHINLLESSGKLVLVFPNKQREFDISKLSEGVYFMHFVDLLGNVMIRKIVKK